MKGKNLLKLLVITLFMSMSTISIAQPSWSFANTGSNHTILVQPGIILVDGVSIVNGDYVGVFFDSLGTLACAGFFVYNGAMNAMTAWGAEPSVLNGLASGETFKWKVWRASDGQEIDMIATYALAGFPNTSTFAANGMSAIATMTGESVVLPLDASGITSDVLCYGDLTGNIDLNITGGIQPYNFIWSNGSTVEDLANIAIGTYSVSITDSDTATVTPIILTFTISEPTQVLISGNSTNVNCNGIADGMIDLTVSGGTIPYSYLWSNGEITEDLFNVGGGTYWVTITDFNGCIDSVSFIINEPTALAVQVDLYPPTCFGGNGDVDITVSGGITPYTYSWDNGVTTEDLTNVPEALYYCTITDINGCTVIIQADIYSPGAVSFGGLFTHVNCYGDATGAFDGSVYGGTSPYSIIWSTGETVEDLVNLVAGIYTVTVTDANGCVLSESYEITQPDQLVISSVVADISCNGANDGSIDLTISGGVTPYTIQWSSGHTSENLAYLTAGNYVVTITDANACVEIGNYTIIEPSLLSVTLSTSNPLCFAGEGNIDVTVTGGTLPYSFLWSNGEITEDITSGAGTYDVTITDAGGCSIALQASLNEPTLVVYSGTVTNVSCFGLTDGAISATTSGGVTPYIFAWSNGETTESISGLTAGTYDITITDTNGCVLTDNFVVTEPAEVVFNPVTTNISCYGANDGSITTGVSGGTTPYTYIWSNNTTSADLTNLGSDDYDITVTDANGCIAIMSFTISEPSLLSATYTSVNPLCFQGLGSIDVTVTGGTLPYTYFWSNSATTEVIDVEAGTYDLTITDANGCIETIQVIITHPDGLSIYSTPSYVTCFGGSDGSITSLVSGGTPPYTHIWSNGATTESVSGLTAGLYYVTVTDANGCEMNNSYLIEEPDQLIVSTLMSVDVLCYNATTGFITISINGGNSPYSYLWSNGETTPNVSQLGAGTYIVTVTDANGCFETLSNTISQPASAVDASFILSEYYVLYNISVFGGNDGSIDMTVTGGTAPYTYNWSNGSFSEDLNNLTAGSYGVTITDANGCVFTSTVILTEPAYVPPIAVNFSVTNVLCFGDENGTIDITITGGTSPYFFSWSNGITTQNLTNLGEGTYDLTITDSFNGYYTGNTHVMDGAIVTTDLGLDATICDGDIYTLNAGTFATYLWSTTEITQTIDITTAGTYAVTVADANGCEGVDEFILTVNALPVVDLGADAAICEGDTYTLDAGIFSAFNWSTLETTQTIDITTAGTYTVTVTDSNGCFGDDEFVLTVNELPVVDLGADTTICNGATITLDADSFASYSWSTNETTQTIDVTEAGYYAVVVTNVYGCEGMDNINIDLSPIITLDADAAICDGESYTLDAGVFDSYVWSNGETTQTIEILTEDTYIVTVSDANGCEGSDDFYLTVYPLPVVDFGTDTITIQDGTTTILDPGVTAASYDWSTGETSSTIEVGLEGEYSVTVSDANGCRGEGEVYVQVIVGISDIEIQNNVVIYPNPVSDILNISYQNLSIERIAVYNSLGKLINDYNNINNEFTFNTQELPEGIYFIKFMTYENKQIIKPFSVIK